MESVFIEQLVQLGLPGLGLLGLGWAYMRERKKNDEIQEKRIAESREGVKAIGQNTNALETLTQVLRDRQGS